MLSKMHVLCGSERSQASERSMGSRLSLGSRLLTTARLKKLIKFACISLAVVFASIVQAQTFKWTDSEGIIHFGDTVPPEYRGQAKQITVDAPKLIGGEENARRIEREMEQFNREIQADQREREREAQERMQRERQRQAAQQEEMGKLGTNAVPTPAITEEEKKQKVIACRNSFPTKAQTMQRVACFRGVHGITD